jgi:hypothetical protein
MILKKSIILISKEGNSDGTRRVPDLWRLSTEGLSDVLNCMPRNWVQAPMETLKVYLRPPISSTTI